MLFTSAARADAGWLESGDTVLRNDLTLLNDAEIIRLPVNQWPIPRAMVEFAREHQRQVIAVCPFVVAMFEQHPRDADVLAT